MSTSDEKVAADFHLEEVGLYLYAPRGAEGGWIFEVLHHVMKKETVWEDPRALTPCLLEAMVRMARDKDKEDGLDVYGEPHPQTVIRVTVNCASKHIKVQKFPDLYVGSPRRQHLKTAEPPEVFEDMIAEHNRVRVYTFEEFRKKCYKPWA